MNRRQLLRSVIYISIFLLLLMMLSYILRTNGSVKNRFAGFYAEPKNSIDVMFFGSSCISRSIAPGYIWGEYGFKSYALSTNSQRSKAILPLIEEALSRQNPRVVVIDTRIFAYDDESFIEDEAHIREITDNMRYSWHRIETINRIAEKEGTDYLSYYLDIIKYHSNIAMLFKPEELAKCWYSKLDEQKGYEPDTETICHVRQNSWPEVDPIEIDDTQEVVLDELIHYLEGKDIEAIFVTSVTKPYPSIMGKIEYIDRVLKKEHIEHINLNKHYEEMDFDTAYDTSDGVHCNSIGAKKCSDYIAAYLTEKYQFASKRGNDNSGTWNNAYNLFLRDYNVMKKNAEGGKIWEDNIEEYE